MSSSEIAYSESACDECVCACVCVCASLRDDLLTDLLLAWCGAEVRYDVIQCVWWMGHHVTNNSSAAPSYFFVFVAT